MTLNLGAVDIRRTMDAAAEGIRDRLIKDGITLDIRAASDIGSFTADERRVRQILFNLLANAVGFSPPGATITLSAERRADAVVFAVTDHGPGIPPEVQDRVFDWFETHSLGSRHRGAGLGLSIVRSFVELHGGTVTLDSAVGQGTTVVCSFPLEQARQSRQRPRDRTVLVVCLTVAGHDQIRSRQDLNAPPSTSGGSSFTVALANEQATQRLVRRSSRPRSSPAIW